MLSVNKVRLCVRAIEAISRSLGPIGEFGKARRDSKRWLKSAWRFSGGRRGQAWFCGLPHFARAAFADGGEDLEGAEGHATAIVPTGCSRNREFRCLTPINR